MKILYIILGNAALVVGILGVFLPLLPTTPFLLLAAALYCRSSRRLYGWLMSNRLLGPYLRNYRLRRAITLCTKIVSLILLWGSILWCIFFVTDLLWLRIALGVTLLAVTAHILSFRTIRKSEVFRMIRVRTKSEISYLAIMADEIWREYYYLLLGGEQIDYMLANIQSPEAIARQIEREGYEYYFINSGGENVGYIAVKAAEGRLLLSKLYVLKAERGKGYAREALLFLGYICMRHGLSAIWLTVNRHNKPSIDVYLKSGFEVIGEEITPIGNGFMMDDLIMEMKIDRKCKV